MFIDSHAHLTVPALCEHLAEVLDRAQKSGVKKIINICTDEESLKQGLELHKKYPWIYLTAATTPHDVEKEGEHFFPLVEAAAQRGDLVAIGETGLDYFYEHSDRALQQHFLLQYFALAKKYHLPLIFHCRDAFADLFALADLHYKEAPALLHCFTGTLEEAEEVVRRGWYLSLSGIVTFKKSEALREVAQKVPLDRLLIETDAPYLAPQSQRGKRNEPAFLIETAECLAKLKGLELEEFARITAENACKFFSLDKE